MSGPSSIYQDVKALQAVVAALQQANATQSSKIAELEYTAQASGDTAWVLVSATLVLMMTIPGLAFFYGGLAQQANVLSTMAQSLVITCVVSVLWMALGYSLTFAEGNAFYGGASRFWLMNVFDNRVGTLPEVLFCMYQMTFAIICVAIITGSFAERMRFGPMIIFSGLWHLLVYCPIAHWEWGPGGFLHYAGVLDFAGGDVIHISSGVAGLASTLIIGKRKIVKENHNEPPPPHNVMLVYLGGAILWVGWFGFNAGSAVAANQSAAMAMLATHISACTAGISWMTTEWLIKKKPSVLGLVSGAVSGLVVVTPGCGYVDQTGAFFMGLLAGPLCYFSIQIKERMGFDDALDAFGVHGVGGVIGGILTGFFANKKISGSEDEWPLLRQAQAGLHSAVRHRGGGGIFLCHDPHSPQGFGRGLEGHDRHRHSRHRGGGGVGARLVRARRDHWLAVQRTAGLQRSPDVGCRKQFDQDHSRRACHQPDPC